MHKTTPASIDQSVTLLGVPVDFNSSYLRGAAEAPELLRKAMACDSSNWWTEQGIYLGQEERLSMLVTLLYLQTIPRH